MKRILLSAWILLFSICAQSQVRYLKGVLSGANEVPANASAASGVVIVVYNTADNTIELYGNYRGLSATISGSHIHQAAAGANGPIRVHLVNTGGTSGTLSVKATLTDEQETALLAGDMYVNVHSEGALAGGEIRSQLTLTTDGQTNFLTARLQGSQEVPPNPSTATGRAYVLLDRGEDKVYVTGNYAGLSATISGSHIHTGNAGANGGIMVHLVNSGANTGTLHAEATVTDAQEVLLAGGGTYVNVHSTGTYAAGEIRGQVTNLSALTYFAGALSGAEEVPANSSTAKGTVIVKYDPGTRLLELTGDYQGLSNTISGSHIHGPAAVGANASVLYPITNTGGSTGTLSLSATITEEQEADLFAGLWYVNVHSSGTFAAGEIRTQLLATSSGRTHYFTGFLQGSQEVPQNASTGSGTVTSIVDALTGKVYVTGSFTGLGSNATMAHIHQAAPGTNGGIIVTLAVPAATAGTVTGSGTLTPQQVTAMLNGNTYVNIHSATLDGGELRAQLGNLVLPVKLLSFTAFREQEKVILAWTTAQENNLLSFDIEQQDAATGLWKKKGTVMAKGGTGNASYRFTDAHAATRNPMLLYRLRINETDGKPSYSFIVKLNFQAARGELTVLSNPVRNGTLRFVVSGPSPTEKLEVSVIDFNGRMVARAKAGVGSINEIAVGHLPAGMYRLVTTVNKEVLQQSFVK